LPTKQQHFKLTNLSVKNFGPIKEANIDMENITVLTGPYNTGKTYIATLAYIIGKLGGFALEIPIVDVLMKKKVFGNFSGKEIEGLVKHHVSEIIRVTKNRRKNNN